MKPRRTLLALWAASQLAVQAQVGVGTTTPDASAQLDVTSTTLGFLPPRMTQAQRVAIVTPAAGLLVYQTDGSPGLYGFDGTAWSTFSGKESALTFGAPFSRTGNTIALAPASGSVAGALTSADWAHFNTAYGWGNHASAGYLTSETDPLFAASAAHGIVAADITAWNAKIGGSGTANYLPAFTASGTVGNSDLFSSANGNVGIGTTTPYTTLTVGSTDATAKITAGGPNTHLTLASAGPAGSIYLNAGGVESGNYSTSTRLTILPEGRVGIGTTTPADLLQVGNLMFGGNSGRDISSTSGYDINYKATGASSHHFYANGTEIFTIDKTGNIGIGINTPDYTLHVNGSVAGTSAYNNLSDARLKKDVLPINDALAIVEALRGVTFNWDKTVDPLMKLDDRNHVGFIAQEVEAVLPQAVSTASDARQTKSVAYSEVIPVLTEAIKQQQSQIDALADENDTLKAQNAAILKRLDALEAK